jgi:ABC-type oligopeptide transport system substrate-binding subunit
MTGSRALLRLAAASASALHLSGFPALAQQAGDRLTVPLVAEPTTLDPGRCSAGVDTYGVRELFEQLLRPDPQGRVVNGLAESWEIAGTPDKPILDIRIRPGVKFHNGDLLTAADLEFSYNRLRDPAQSCWVHPVDRIDPVPPAVVEEFRAMPGVSTATAVGGNNLYMDMPSEQPGSPFHDDRVRQALPRAADMDAIIRRVPFGQRERPLVTLAWRTDKVTFTPRPSPGFYRNFQEIGVR